MARVVDFGPSGPERMVMNSVGVRDAADCRLAKKLGMSEYARRFAENRIDVSVLPDLTDQDLEKLGVLLGDRRKILRAIANLEGAEKERTRERRCCSSICCARGIA